MVACPCKPQGVRSVVDSEDRLQTAVPAGLDHSLYGEGTSVHIAAYLAAGGARGLTGEVERGSERECIVRTNNLEVGILIEQVAGYGLTKAERNNTAHRENTISRRGCAEEFGSARIFHTMEHFGCSGNKAVAIACECHSAQVIFLLHRVATAVETDIVDFTARDALFGAGSQLIEAVRSVVGADVHPIGIGGGMRLILQLDMVEAIGVDVEAIDRNGQVVACGVSCSLRVEYPLVMGSRHADGSRGRYEMDGESCECVLLNVACGAQSERDILEVITLSTLYLYSLVNRSTMGDSDGYRVRGERLAIYCYLQSVGVRSRHY